MSPTGLRIVMRKHPPLLLRFPDRADCGPRGAAMASSVVRIVHHGWRLIKLLSVLKLVAWFIDPSRCFNGHVNETRFFPNQVRIALKKLTF